MRVASCGCRAHTRHKRNVQISDMPTARRIHVTEGRARETGGKGSVWAACPIELAARKVLHGKRRVREKTRALRSGGGRRRQAGRARGRPRPCRRNAGPQGTGPWREKKDFPTLRRRQRRLGRRLCARALVWRLAR